MIYLCMGGASGRLERPYSCAVHFWWKGDIYLSLLGERGGRGIRGRERERERIG